MQESPREYIINTDSQTQLHHVQCFLICESKEVRHLYCKRESVFGEIKYQTSPFYSKKRNASELQIWRHWQIPWRRTKQRLEKLTGGGSPASSPASKQSLVWEDEMGLLFNLLICFLLFPHFLCRGIPPRGYIASAPLGSQLCNSHYDRWNNGSPKTSMS